MKNVILPYIWLIVLIVGLPQLSETVYTPSLPEISMFLNTTGSIIEYTLTIYLFGFSVGTFFWGCFSDRFGRKPSVLLGLIVFIIGCVLCFKSESIELLMIGRFIQAFGGSIGSVVGQAICRDAFHGNAIGRVYSIIGTALSIFPALGPIIGGFIAENFGWQNIFIFLILFAILLFAFVCIFLSETHKYEKDNVTSIKNVFLSLISDKKVIGFAIIVAASNGIGFSYFAEGSFYLISLLGLSPSQYGVTFVCIAFGAMFGGITSNRLHSKISSYEIMKFGIKIIFISTIAFSVLSIIHSKFLHFSNKWMILITVSSQMITMFGICMTTSNGLALSLVDYKKSRGTASSLFGFLYYCLIAIFTFGMGLLHNGTLLSMPIYFLCISIIMLFVQRRITNKYFEAEV